MSTLRVDNIKGRTGTTVNIPDSNNLSVSGSLSVSGVTTFTSSGELNLQGTNINSGARGEVLSYDSTGKLVKVSLGSAGQILKSDGTDLVFGDLGGATNVYYVAKNGVDAAGRGGSIDAAWASIKYACSNLPVTPTKTSPAVIFVKSGTYLEGQLPIIVPEYTTIVGDNLRATTVKPAPGLDSGGSTVNQRSTLFRCSNGVIIQDILCDGMDGYQVGSPASDPTAGTLGGVYFALNAQSPITDKSPYIYNVTTFGNGATGAVVDGSLHSSGNRSMLFHTVTHIHSDGLGIWAKDNANAEIISGFTYYCQIGYTATGGSKIRSLNSSNSYGEFGVFSKGFDSSETANSGTVRGVMLTYQGVVSGTFNSGELITGAGGATAYVINVQSEPKVLYVIPASGTFQSGELVTGAGGATVNLVAGTVTSNQSGRVLVTQFSTSADAGDSLQFATTDGNAYQIQSVSSVTANNIAYHVLVFSTSRATPVADGVTVNVRKEYSQVRLTGHDFLNVGTGGTDTTNWPGNPTQSKVQANQVVTLPTDPGRVYYVATDEEGNFYVGDQFKVEQATGKATLDASAFDLSGLESLQLGSIGGLIGASVNEFSTDGTMAQNSNQKVPTQAAVRSYIANTNHNFAGNITFSGTTTTIDTATLSVEDKNIGIGSVTSPTNTTASGGGLTLFGGADGDKEFKWIDSAGPDYWSLNGGLLFSEKGANLYGLLKEKVSISADKLSVNTQIDVGTSAIHYRTTTETTTSTPNLRYSAGMTLNDAMNVGEALTVTIITTAAAAGYSEHVTIDGNNVTENWIGGSAPADGGASGVDIYTYNVIKTANATFTVIANQTKTS
tara:strand:+ start:2344 stop:4857 length:2514 start_codon:yes stop_codon:yes gene_type:complete